MPAPTSNAPATPTAGGSQGPTTPVVPCEPAWEVDTGDGLFASAAAPLARISASSAPPAPAATSTSTSTSTSATDTPEPDGAGEHTGTISPAAAERAVRSILVAVLEVIDGRRPPATVSAVLAPAPLLQVTRLARATHRPADAARIRTVHVTVSHTKKANTSGIEVCATYARGRRLFAVAAHMEARDGRIRCTGLRMPS